MIEKSPGMRYNKNSVSYVTCPTEGDGIYMKRFVRIAALFSLMAVALMAAAGSAQALSASVVMKVSRTAQDSVVNVGEDLTIDVDIEGVEPAMCRWFFEDELIEGAGSSVLSIGSASLEDAGAYRMEAYDAEGAMLVSMEFAVRVVDKALPKSGDDTLGAGAVAGGMTLCAAGLTALMVRRRRAA